jgi:probable rRNA maturation factor
MNEPGSIALAAPPGEEPADSEPPEQLSVAIVYEAGDWSAFPSCEEAIGTAVAALASPPRSSAARGAEVTIVLADDALVRALNRTYRGKDKPTNVLSFPFRAPPGAEACGILGDVVLAAETILHEARARAVAPVHHLQHLVIHGVLHLLGFEHETDAEAEEMERLETKALADLGVSDPHTSNGPV